MSWEWKSEAIENKSGVQYKPGEIPTAWYAYDVMDGKRLSPKSMQDGLKDEEIDLIWKKKHWSGIKEKLYARELINAEEYRQVNSWSDLKRLIEGKRQAKSSIVIPPEEVSATIPMSEEKSDLIEKVKFNLKTPIDITKVNVASKSGRVSGGSELAEKIGAAVADKL